ncbi:MAG: peptidase [Candidatus Marinimicrobia bacterium]|nr:peptidase [Candidatus Neomarinimicrobiota bacterium]MCF7830324.1 peptidase [Candidatus Neomarinimicrobiota bacterium]MCF7882301.1 peptidase [Candidatus Neomarinimicrobiota bacterium]
MRLTNRISLIVCLICLPITIHSQNTGADTEMLRERINRFAKTQITYDHSLMDTNQRKVVENLYHAAVIMDSLFLDQVYEENPEIKRELQTQTGEKANLQMELFNIMFGPFDRLDGNKPFYGNNQKPAGANYYPGDMTREEFNRWIEEHPEDEEAFESEYTMIRRRNGDLVAIPYSEYYNERLTEAANYLREAAKFAENPTVKRYLNTRADAFLSNDYYESDMAWMDMEDHLIEVVIGPYEVYEDALFNYKAAFECFITLRDPEESAKVAKFAEYLTEMEQHLPIPEEYKNPDRGSESPIVVAQEVFSAGDTKAGVQTLAFNLPNDERVRKAKGSKKVLLKNVNEAKFDKLLRPIAGKILESQQLEYVTFNAFFDHVLMHEMSHGIGPGYITVDGRETEVRDELKETYSTIEECKADILGMYNNIFMVEKGEYPESMVQETWVTYLAGIFRSARFGIGSAHGAGNAIIFNYFLDKGAYEYDESARTVRVNFDKVYEVTESLATTLLTIQATGDYLGAKELIGTYGVLSPEMETVIAELSGVPVDIRPVYEYQQEMME